MSSHRGTSGLGWSSRSRIAIAFLLSVALNVALLSVDFFIDPRQEKLSRIEDFAVDLLKPAEALTMWLAPGHGRAQLLFIGIFSIVVYAIEAWMVMSLAVWWRRRT